LPPHFDTPQIRDRLLRTTAHLPFDVFSIGRRGLRTRDVVGVVDIEDGPPRRYHEMEEVLPVLRGRLDLKKIACRKPGNDHQVPIRYAPLQPRNTLSRLLKALISELSDVTRSAKTRAMLQHTSDILGDVDVVRLTPSLVDRVQLSPFESGWQGVVEIAAALAQGRAPDPTALGGQMSFGLLFPLYDLFEAVLRRSIRLALADENICLVRRESIRLLRSLEPPSIGRESLELRPDFLFLRPDTSLLKVLVGDAKWKRLTVTSGKLDVAPSDVYQLSTYMMRYEVGEGILFFPMTDWMAGVGYCWSHRYEVIGGTGKIRIVGVDVESLVSRDKARRVSAIGELRSLIVAACH